MKTTKRMKIGSTQMSKESVLKIDKGCHLDRSWMRDYVQTVKTICRNRNLRVSSVEMSHTNKGHHFYIGIQPSVSAHLANRLQFLLGDDPRRVDYNRARIRSRYPEWNKLFENLGRRFWVLYRSKVPAGTRKTGKR